MVDYDRLIILDKGRVRFSDACNIDALAGDLLLPRLQNSIPHGILFEGMVAYSGICVFRAGSSVNWRVLPGTKRNIVNLQPRVYAEPRYTAGTLRG